MSFNAREIDAPPSVVFDVLADPETYPRWLIGASAIREVDHNWPSPGAKFHHLVGIKPFVVPDNTEVIDVEPGESLTLQVRVGPFVSAIAQFRIVGNGARSIVSVKEEPAARLIGNMARPVLDPLIHFRNDQLLRRLELVVVERVIDANVKRIEATGPTAREMASAR